MLCNFNYRTNYDYNYKRYTDNKQIVNSHTNIQTQRDLKQNPTIRLLCLVEFHSLESCLQLTHLIIDRIQYPDLTIFNHFYLVLSLNE